MGTKSVATRVKVDPAIGTDVTLDTASSVKWTDLTPEQQERVKSFTLDPAAVKAGTADYSPAEVALVVGLQKDYADAASGRAMVNAGLFVYDQITRGNVGSGEGQITQAALAAAIRRSEGYVSRLKNIGKAAALGLPEEQVSFVVNNPGGKTTAALKDATSKTAASKAVGALVKAASAAPKGKGGTRKPRPNDKGGTETRENTSGKAATSGGEARKPRTLGDARTLLASLAEVLAGLSEADLRTMIGETHAMLDNETTAREQIASKPSKTAASKSSK